MRRTAIAAGIIGVAVIAARIWSVTQRELPAPAAAVAEEPLVEAPPEPETVEAVVQPEPEAEPSLNDQLKMASDVTTSDYALAALFETWGLEYRTGGRGGCSQAAEAGLMCLYQRGSWGGLRQMDRPAILTLVDNDGNDHEVVLTGITNGNAELSLGGVRVTHSVTDISDVWLGEFMLLWRPPTGAAVSLGPGSRGGDVAWLRNSLAAIDGRYASTDVQSEVFDAELEQLVRSFQRDHRLEVDGLAGQQTQIIINSLLAVEGTPRLSTPRLAQD